MSIAFINSAVAGSSNTNSATTSGVDTTGATFIVISAASYIPGGAVTISDSKGNTYTALTARSSAALTNRLYYCAAPIVGSGHTFTVSGTSVYPTIAAAAFAGLASSPLDQQTGSNNASGTSAATGSITAATNNALLIAGLAVNNGTSITINSGFTSVVVDYAGGLHFGGGLGYKIKTASGAENPTWSWTSSGENCESLASFNVADFVFPQIVMC
jgi:hypothetical protein